MLINPVENVLIPDPGLVPGEEQARGEGEEGVREQGLPGGQGLGRALPLHSGNVKYKCAKKTKDRLRDPTL